MTIAFIGFGEAGGILAADLAREHAEHDVGGRVALLMESVD